MTHWADLQEVTTSLGIRFLFFIYKILGRLPVLIILYPVILWFYVTNKVARNSSRDYLNHLYLYSNKTTPKPSIVNNFMHLYAFGECILDKLIIWSGQIEDLDYTLEGLDGFDVLIGENLGAVVVVSHLGNLDFCRAIAKRYPNLNLTVLVHTTHAVKFNQLLKLINPESALNIIQVSNFSMHDAILLSEKIQAGGLISIAGDRVPLFEGNTIPVQFLGAAANFPIGAYVLAKTLKSPLFSLLSIKVNGQYQLSCNQISNWVEGDEISQDDIVKAANAFAQVLERGCLQAPFQWFNFYPFWKGSDGI